MPDSGDEDFETRLKRDLPRGLEDRPLAYGRDRGLLSRWLIPKEMTGAPWEAADGLLLGMREGREIGWKDNRHLLTIAGSRAGKGVSMIIPNLIHYRGSAFVIDPKGENAARTAAHRGEGVRGGAKGLGQSVYVLDPFGESGVPTSCFNPLAALKVGSATTVDDAGVFADALIMHPETGERHWTESAQAVIRALMLVVISDGLFADRRNLLTVRRLLTLTDPAIETLQKSYADREKQRGEESGEPPDQDRKGKKPKELKAEKALIKLLHDQPDEPFGSICAGVAEQLMAMGNKERGSVLSSARTQTQWLDSPAMKKVLAGNDFDLADLKRKNMTVYLCLPATRMGTHARWLRLMVLQAIGIMEREKAPPALPVLFVLDEFPVLGFIQSIETAAGLMAGFGVKLWPIVQNVGQLKQHYPKSWETFVANSGVITAFGISDSETLKVLSEFVGQTGIVAEVDSGVSKDAGRQGAEPLRDDRSQVPLLAPHELRLVFGRAKNRALVFNVESDPGVVERFVYYGKNGLNNVLFDGRYVPDPKHTSPL